MKQKILFLIRALGYDIVKVNRQSYDLDTYNQYYTKGSIDNKRFYNIGAGNFYHPYWTNIDFYSDWYKKNNKKSLSGIHHDLMSLNELPIVNDSAEIVYSSHTVEHITDTAAQKLFDEAHRILKKGGILRITTPNVNLDYRAFVDNDRNYFYWIDNYSKSGEIERIKIIKPMNQSSLEQIFLYHFAGNVSMLHKHGAKERISDEELKNLFSNKSFEEALNYCTSKCDLDIQLKYPGNHINWWNPEKMEKMFKKSGFEHIYISGYGQSFSPVLRNVALFDNTHPKISLYMEAVK
jgi:predicted SAM-dependent methyltransferase